MAGSVVKARYSRGGSGSSMAAAKGHVRYAVHRSDELGQRQYRAVWGADGELSKADAYRQLDEATSSDYVYRLTLSPHPTLQDAGHRLDLRAWTREMMEQLGQRGEWFAVAHEHPDHRHVHVVAITVERLNVQDFAAMRAAGDELARDNRRERTRER